MILAYVPAVLKTEHITSKDKIIPCQHICSQQRTDLKNIVGYRHSGAIIAPNMVTCYNMKFIYTCNVFESIRTQYMYFT
jgi:hypothetical protein